MAVSFIGGGNQIVHDVYVDVPFSDHWICYPLLQELPTTGLIKNVPSYEMNQTDCTTSATIGTVRKHYIPEGEDNKSNGRKRAHQHKRHGQSRDTDKTEHTRHRTNKRNYSEE
jgi:hypothetical protein